VILITTGENQIAGTIPTEIGQLTVLDNLYLGKYDECLRSLHALFFIYTHIFRPLFAVNRSQFTNNIIVIHRYCPLFVILITTGENQISGTIPTEIGQLTVLTSLYLCKYDECLRSLHALFFIYAHIFLPLFAVNRSQFTNNTIVIHRHIVHFL
jgi:hypothetical protein